MPAREGLCRGCGLENRLEGSPARAGKDGKAVGCAMCQDGRYMPQGTPPSDSETGSGGSQAAVMMKCHCGGCDQPRVRQSVWTLLPRVAVCAPALAGCWPRRLPPTYWTTSRSMRNTTDNTSAGSMIGNSEYIVVCISTFKPNQPHSVPQLVTCKDQSNTNNTNQRGSTYYTVQCVPVYPSERTDSP